MTLKVGRRSGAQPRITSANGGYYQLFKVDHIPLQTKTKFAGLVSQPTYFFHWPKKSKKNGLEVHAYSGPLST